MHIVIQNSTLATDKDLSAETLLRAAEPAHTFTNRNLQPHSDKLLVRIQCTLYFLMLCLFTTKHSSATLRQLPVCNAGHERNAHQCTMIAHPTSRSR